MLPRPWFPLIKFESEGFLENHGFCKIFFEFPLSRSRLITMLPRRQSPFFARELRKSRSAHLLCLTRCKNLWRFSLFCCLILLGLGSIVLSSVFSLFYLTGECHRFLHRGWANLFLISFIYMTWATKPTKNRTSCHYKHKNALNLNCNAGFLVMCFRTHAKLGKQYRWNWILVEYLLLLRNDCYWRNGS